MPFSKRSLLPVLPSLLILALLIFFLYRQIDDVSRLTRVIQEASLPLLLTALLLQFLSYIALTWHHLILLSPFSGQVGFFRLLGVILAMAFVETAMPLGGVSTTAVRVRLLRRNGYTPEASIFTMIVGGFYLLITVAIAALAGLVYLTARGEISMPAVMGIVVVSLALGIATIAVVYFLRYPRRARRWLRVLTDRWHAAQERHKWLPGEIPSEEHLDERVATFYETVPRFLRLSQPTLWFSIGLSTVLDIISLALCFWAFGVLPAAAIILTAYGITILVTMLGALPGGVGVAEAALALAYTGLGIPPEIALPAAVSFRFMSYWLMRIIGALVWYGMEHRHSRPKKDVAPSSQQQLPIHRDDARL